MFLRPARTTDADEVSRLHDICLRTGAGGTGAQHLHEDPRLLGEVYVGAYLRFEPDLAFVLESGNGTALGYVLGAADTHAFEELLEQQWWPALRRRYPLGFFPAGSHDEKIVGLIHSPRRAPAVSVGGFPAHLHVNILPEGQGGGNGRRLLEVEFDALRRRGAVGVHLGVASENTRAIGFYEHLGFRSLGENLFGLTL